MTGWQREYQRAEDELDNPRSLALPDWDTLCRLAAAELEELSLTIAEADPRWKRYIVTG